ncbi:MAG: hypothetical protein NTW75_06980, partial [Planctomycetales bacterium]|nr:hypothetical protein [Planctomycetales bacterium]
LLTLLLPPSHRHRNHLREFLTNHRDDSLAPFSFPSTVSSDFHHGLLVSDPLSEDFEKLCVKFPQGVSATVLGTPEYKTVVQWLQMLVTDRQLDETDKGGLGTNRRTRYRWTGERRP